MRVEWYVNDKIICFDGLPDLGDLEPDLMLDCDDVSVYTGAAIEEFATILCEALAQINRRAAVRRMNAAGAAAVVEEMKLLERDDDQES